MLVVVGRIVRPHGIRGEVAVDVRSDDPADRFATGAKLFTSPDTGPLTIEYARPHRSGGRNRLLVAFEEVPDREAAEQMRGVELLVNADKLAALEDPDEFYDHQLVGLHAVTADDQQLGEVVRVDHPPGNDLLVLRTPQGGQALVPFVAAIVTEVDLVGARLVMAPPPGLFDL